MNRFVRSLPDGYDTVIDEEGSNVSAGEKQLITIARAFLSNHPSLLILDEATSSVDTVTGAAGGQPQCQTGQLAVSAGQAVVDTDAIITDTERIQSVALRREILLL